MFCKTINYFVFFYKNNVFKRTFLCCLNKQFYTVFEHVKVNDLSTLFCSFLQLIETATKIRKTGFAAERNGFLRRNHRYYLTE